MKNTKMFIRLSAADRGGSKARHILRQQFFSLRLSHIDKLF